MSCGWIQLVLLTIYYSSNSVLALIRSIVSSSHFRTWCIRHFRCNRHTIFVLVLNCDITIFLSWCVWNKIIVVNDIGIAFYHFTSFRSLSCGWIQLVLLTIYYSSNSVLALIRSIVSSSHFRTWCIRHFRCNRHTIFVLVLNCDITIFFFYRLFNFVINIDNAGCSLNNLTTFLTLCSIGINTISCAIIRRNGSWFVISCIIVSTNP